MLGRVGQGMPVYPDVSAIGRDGASDEVQEGGFAGAVFFAQGHAPGREAVGEALEDEVVAVAFAEIVES